MSSEKLKIIPLGGLGEIGMNCMVLEWQDQIILIDCGVQFPDFRYVGVDVLVPDLSYLRERLHKLSGIMVTHGHDDHIGAIPFLARERDLDIYCTAFPQGLLEHKLSEYNDLHEVRFHRIVPRKMFEVGAFKLDPIPVSHSIIEALGFGIETPVGNIVHSGDFKHDPALGGSFDPFKEWGNKGVHLLFSDSTNSDRCGHTVSETEVLSSFDQTFANQTSRLFIALFASNIRRIENLLNVAHKRGKKVVFCGRSMHNYTQLAHMQESMSIPNETLILEENIHDYPADRIVVLMTGSQAEPQSALVRVSNGVHKNIKIQEGDRILLSSRFIPGNERAITNMIDQLCRLGAEVTYESIEQIHVSGHGFQDELLMMLESVKPRFFVPVHGDYRHLFTHAGLARSTGVKHDDAVVIEDGQLLELDKESLTLGEKYELQKSVIVRGSYMNSDPSLFSQRLALSRTGVVFVSALRDKKRNSYSFKIAAHGIVLESEADLKYTLEDAEYYLEQKFGRMQREMNDAPEVVRLLTRRYFKRIASHKPTVVSIILDI